ncbi:hypothetical protein C8J57DRAFT_1672025 [Mycena rebaudengoi]|nr:hypothetical protein C8J57DRAFT_1672025 [Mycena rebaudengoi]
MADHSEDTLELLPAEVPSQTRGFDMLPILPFASEDDDGDDSDLLAPPKDADRVLKRPAINYVAMQSWKELRMPSTSAVRAPPHDLSMLPGMHIDILYEVIGHLHPIDLIHLSRTSTDFRALLLARAAAPLWRDAFEGRRPLPACPQHISGRRWALLLFGVRRCEACGDPDTSPDYIICRRLCTDCMDAKLVTDVPGYEASHLIQTLVPKTFRTDGSIPAAYGDEGRLWPPDGVALAEAYTRLESESDDADGKEALERFVETRTALVAEAERLAEDCDNWSQDLSRRYLDDGRTQGARVLKSVTKRLIAAGHAPADVTEGSYSIMDSPYLDKIPRLTSKRYNKALPHLLPILHAAHSARLSRRRATLQKTVLTASQAARAAAPPGAWAYWPPGYTLQAWAPLRALVDDELAREEAEELAGGGADAEVDAGEAGAQGERRIAAAVAQQVPGLVEAWRAERKRQLVELLPCAGELEDAADPARGGACGDADADADVGGAKGADARAAGADDVLRLDLATSVFTCLGSWVPGTRVHAGRCLIGWVGAGAHLRCGSLQSFWENRLHHEPEGARAAAVLVRLAGRDPASTSAAEMDKVDARYVCGGCAVQARGGVRGRKALTWRESVLHAVEVARGAEPGHAEGAGWAVLSRECAADVRRRERADAAHMDRAWVCTLCAAHFDKHVLREEARRHVREAHAIPRPVQDSHFMFFPGAERTPRVAALLSEEGLVAEYRCAHCVDVLPQVVRLFSMRALERHVCDKHGCNVVREADWTRVERIAGSSAVEPVSRSSAVEPTPTPLDALPE